MSELSCVACKCVENKMDPAIAFLAGVAFYGTFNTEAMKARLCDHHKRILSKSWAGAIDSVDARDLRDRR